MLPVEFDADITMRRTARRPTHEHGGGIGAAPAAAQGHGPCGGRWLLAVARPLGLR